MQERQPSRVRVPSLRRHKPSGQAVVTLSGKDHYLGPWRSAVAQAEYDRLTALWLASGRCLPQREEVISIARLVIKYMDHAEAYYRRLDGSQTFEVANVKSALKPLLELFGKEDANAFGAADLKAVRQRMIDAGRVRSQINKAVSRIVRMFRWAVENGQVPSPVWQELRAVSGLKLGRSEAVESEPVKPVPDADIDEVVKAAPPAIATMIRLQQYSGCRPGEVADLTTAAIDRTGKVWVYSPAHHKTRHQGRRRSIYFGPKAQELLLPWLRANQDEPLFSPAETMNDVRDRRAAARQTPKGQGNSKGSNRKARPKRKPGDRYTVSSYGHAISRTCERLWPTKPTKEMKEKGERLEPEVVKANTARHWNPNQLRHAAATRIRRDFGLEAAQVLLGHSKADVTQIYAERDTAKAVDVASRAG